MNPNDLVAFLDTWKLKRDLERKRQLQIDSGNPLGNTPGLSTLQAIEAAKNRTSGLTAQDEENLKHGMVGRDLFTYDYSKDTFMKAGLPDSLSGLLASLYTPFMNSEVGRKFINTSMGVTDTVASGLTNVPALLLGGVVGKISEGVFGGNSIFTDASKKLFDLDAAYKNLSDDISKGVVGTDPTFWDNVFHGAGTSLGFMTLGTSAGALARSLWNVSPLVSNIIGFGVQNLAESLTEAGNAASDAYASDKSRYTDALLAGLYSFGANGITDFFQSLGEGKLETWLNNVLPTTGSFTRQLLTEAFKHLTKEEINELLQEPRQQAVEQAIKNVFNSGDMSLANLGYHLGNEASHIFKSYTDDNGNVIPSYWSQVAPETAMSTLLTSLATFPLGISFNKPRNSRNSPQPTQQQLVDERNKLIQKRDYITDRINQIHQSYGEDIDSDADIQYELNNLYADQAKLDNIINNFWNDRAVTPNPVQDDNMDLFPDRDELNSENTSNLDSNDDTNVSAPDDVNPQNINPQVENVNDPNQNQFDSGSHPDINSTEEQKSKYNIGSVINWINSALGFTPSTQNETNEHVGFFHVLSNGQNIKLSVEPAAFSDKYKNQKKFFGRFFNIKDQNGNIIARYAPYTGNLQMADNNASPDLKLQIQSVISHNLNDYLSKGGFLDDNGKLIADGYDKFRHKFRTRLDTSPEGSLVHSNNQRESIPLRDNRSFLQRFKDNKAEKNAFEGVQHDIQKKIETMFSSWHDKAHELGRELYHGLPKESAQYYSAIYAARLRAAAHAAGMSINDLYKVWNLRFDFELQDLSKNKSNRGNVEMTHAGKIIKTYGHIQDVILHDDNGHLIKDENGKPKIKKLLVIDSDASTLLHEGSHIFLEDFRELMRLDNLPEQVKYDWAKLIKWLGVADIDLTKDKSQRTQDEQRRWDNAQEKFAVASEQYYMKGKAPNSWLKRIFKAFKSWLTDIYSAVKNIKYMGTDNRAHEIEIPKEIKLVFDNLFNDTAFVPNQANREARFNRAGLSGETESHNQSAKGQNALETTEDERQNTSESFNQPAFFSLRDDHGNLIQYNDKANNISADDVNALISESIHNLPDYILEALDTFNLRIAVIREIQDKKKIAQQKIKKLFPQHMIQKFRRDIELCNAALEAIKNSDTIIDDQGHIFDFYPQNKNGERIKPRKKTQLISVNELLLTPNAHKQYLAVVQKLKDSPLWLKAPNGKPTNLTEDQWVLARTQNFKKWFGDWENHPENASKVLDENGEPLVVYHGTSQGGFSKFNTKGHGKTLGTGAFFHSNKEAAESYFFAGSGKLKKQLYSVFINIRNPYILDAKGSVWNDLGKFNNNAYPTTDDVIRAVWNGSLGNGNHDGVIFNNISDTLFDYGQLSNVFVTPQPKYIKSATDNNGNFGNNGDIYKQPALGKQNSIRDVLDIMHSELGRKNSGNVWVDYAHVSHDEANRISKATGLNITDRYVHSLAGEAVAHVEKRHGLNNEQRQDQLPITDADFELIPDIIQNPDEISRGTEKTTGKLNDTIVYKKRINGHVLIVEEVRTKRGKLAFHTMRKSKAGYDFDLSKEGHPIVNISAASQRITSDHDLTPEAQFPHDYSNDSLFSGSDYVNSRENETYNQSIDDPEVKRTLDIFRSMLKRADPSNIDFDNLLKNNYGFISDQTAEMFNQPVYAGTRHIIRNNKFDLSKVGSGEGGTSFGWGAYFAQNPKVSAHYRTAGMNNPDTAALINVSLKNGEVIVADSSLDPEDENFFILPDSYDPEEFADSLLCAVIGDIVDAQINGHLYDFKKRLSKKYNDIIEKAQHALDTQDFDDSIPLNNKHWHEINIRNHSEMLNILDNISGVTETYKNGNLYLFDIPENDVLLDWDLPLNQQPQHVKKAIEKIFQTGLIPQNSTWNIKGMTLYRLITEHFARSDHGRAQTSWLNDKASQKKTSMLLNKFGVPGLRYWDKFSRDKKNGTHNFVIWNNEAIKMLGIDPSSDQDAIDYFNKYKEQHQDGFINQDAVEKLDQLAYHGTGHIILGNKFNLQYVGSGEGHSTYGHGAYFAQNQKVSETYRHEGLQKVYDRAVISLSNGFSFTINEGSNDWENIMNGNYEGLTLPPNISNEAFVDALKEFFYDALNATSNWNFKSAKKKITQKLKHVVDVSKRSGDFRIANACSDTLKALKLFKDFKIEGIRNGNVYIFDIPENDDLLNWDDKLSNQSSKLAPVIQEIIDEINNDPAYFLSRGLVMEFEGKDNTPTQERLEALIKTIFDKAKQAPEFSQNMDAGLFSTILTRIPEFNSLEKIIGSKSALEVGLALLDRVNNTVNLDWTAENLYRTIETLMNTTNPDVYVRQRFSKTAQANTSMYLNSKGILGHRYFDQQSRYDKSGSYNFVIWNMDKISLTGIDPSSDQEAIDYFNKFRNENHDAESYNQNVAQADSFYLSPEAKAQVEAVRKQYQGTEKWLKAPNGKQSNLNEAQWLAVRTPNFKRWFGDWENDPQNASKVLDENAEPLVVYHGTRNGGFSVFHVGKVGAVFSSSKQAVGFSYSGSDDENKNFALFLNIRNPYILDAKGKNWASLDNDEGSTDKTVRAVLNGKYGYGFDGIIFRNISDLGPHRFNKFVQTSLNGNHISDVYAIFNNRQPKSATRNNGNFSDQSDIYHQIIGLGGAKRLDEAEGVTWRNDNLKIARKMDHAKSDSNTIWAATGWMRGADKKWRMEIPDGKIIRIKLNELRKINAEFDAMNDKLRNNPGYVLAGEEKDRYDFLDNYDIKLHNFFDAPQLFDAYPDARNILVAFSDFSDDLIARYDPNFDLIEINYNVQNNRELRLNLIHEIQHAIQFYEGFANGDNFSLDDDATFKKAHEKINRILDRLNNNSADRVRNVLEAENKGNTSLADSLIDSLNPDELNAYHIAHNYSNIIKERYNTLYSRYERHAGETEARNTQTRAYWSDKKRRKTPLDRSEDVPRDQQIVGKIYKKNPNSTQSKNFISPQQIEQFNQLMWHGTRHLLEGNKFDLRFLSSGEGGQAYGYGIYLAQNKAVAQSYRKAGSSENGIIFKDRRGNVLLPIDVRDNIETYVNTNALWGVQPKLDAKALVDEITALLNAPKDTFKKRRHDIIKKFADNIIQQLENKIHPSHLEIIRKALFNTLGKYVPVQISKIEVGNGNLYSVDGPEDFELLNWNAPMHEQSAPVLDKLKRAGLYLHDNETGAQLYRRLQKQFGSGDEGARLAAMALNDAGIPGHRFWDAGSRISESGTHNFVIWNTDTLRLLGISDDSQQDAQDYYHAEDYHNAYLDSLDNDSDVIDYSNNDYNAELKHLDEFIDQAANDRLEAMDIAPDSTPYYQAHIFNPQQLEQFNQIAYTGTGNIILGNKFDLKFVGSNEGGARFGYGAYLSEITDVAEHYRLYGLPDENDIPLDLRVTLNDGSSYSWNDVDFNPELRNIRGVMWGLIQYFEEHPHSTNKQALDDIRHGYLSIIQRRAHINKSKDQDFVRRMQQELDALDSIQDIKTSRHQGNIYIFNIPENHELLDWDAPLDQQPEAVKLAIDKIFNSLHGLGYSNEQIKQFSKNAGELNTGEDLYSAVTGVMNDWLRLHPHPLDGITRPDARASMLFNKFGIPGHRYFNKFSRDNKSGTHNFVIWDTSSMNMLGLSDDSDQDAKDYFNEYNQPEINPDTLNLDDVPDNFVSDDLVERYNQGNWHGTGHIVENNEFDLSKVGTGEGLQVFGYGIYSAQLKDVAGEYRLMGIDEDDCMAISTKDGKTFYSYSGDYEGWGHIRDDVLRKTFETLSEVFDPDLSNDENINEAKSLLLEELEKHQGNLSFYIENRDKKLDNEEYDEEYDEELNELEYEVDFINDTIAALNSIDKIKIIPPKNGNLYRVDVPENWEVLDWDKKLKQQPPKIVHILRGLIRNFDRLNMTGGQFYHWLSDKLGSQKKASMWLLKHGIPGLRYFDGWSRNKQNGTHNFVTWDMNRIKMLGIDPSSDQDAIDYFNKYKAKHPNGFINREAVEHFDQLRLHGTGHIILNNQFNLQFIGSGEGVQAFGHGIYFAEKKAVAESYRRYGLKNGGLGNIHITTKDGSVLNNSAHHVWDHSPSDNISVLLYELEDAIRRESWFNKKPNFSRIKREITRDLKSGLDDVLASIQRGKQRLTTLHEGTEAFNDLNDSIQVAQSAADLLNEKIKFLRSIKSFELDPDKNGNIYIADIPDDDELLNWDASLGEQNSYVSIKLQDTIDAINLHPEIFIAFQFSKFAHDPTSAFPALSLLLTHSFSHIDVYQSEGGDWATQDVIKQLKSIFKNRYDHRIIGAIGDAIHYAHILNIAKLDDMSSGNSLYRALTDIMNSKELASEWLNSHGIPGLRYWDRQSRDKKTGTHNYVIWNMDKIRIVGLDESSDQDAINYFNNHNDNHETFNQSQDANRIFDSFRNTLLLANPDDINLLNFDKQNFGFISDDFLERFNQPGYNGTGRILLNNEFDLSKIGSGEGNSYYGWGAYFAQNITVSNSYRHFGLDAPTIRVADKNGDTTTYHKGWRPFIPDFIGANDTIDFIREAYLKNPAQSMQDILSDFSADLKRKINSDDYNDYDKKQFRATLNALPDYSFEFIHHKKGNLYIFDLPENYVLLDWDLPLSQQPDHVRYVIEKIYQLDFLNHGFGWDITGGDLYRDITNFFLKQETSDDNAKSLSQSNKWRKDKNNQKKTSMLLNRFGIPGLRFFDKGSRQNQQGTRNFVIWNQEAIKLIGIDESSDQEAIDYFNAHNNDSVILDKDKKLKQQPPKIVHILRTLIRNFDRLNMTGGQFYHWLSDKLGSQEKASSWLLKHGIHLDNKDYSNAHNDNSEAYNQIIGEQGAITIDEANGQNINDDAHTLSMTSSSQIAMIRNQFEGSDKWLKAPNGEKSNLSESQWLIVRTPNFKRWFGDWENDPQNASKIVDKNGEPLVVTHISRNNKKFSVFNTNGDLSPDGLKTRATGAWFGDLKGNEDTSLAMAGFNSQIEGQNIFHVFLNIRNPYFYDAHGKRWQRVGNVWIDDAQGLPIYHNKKGQFFSNLSWAEGFIRDHLGNDHKRYSVQHSDFQTSDELVRAVRNAEIGEGNHDGVIIHNLRDMSVWGVDDFIAFYPEQIKSAVYNNGNLNPSDPDIYHQSPNQADNLDRSQDSFLSDEAKAQIDALKSKYEGSDYWLKAPNGKDTNLNELQWLLVRTHHFKNWFGDWENDPNNSSKAIDDNGEPLIVYHGSKADNISIFYTKGSEATKNAGAFFSSSKPVAKSYILGKLSDDKLYPVFLNIRNPYTLGESNNLFWSTIYEYHVFDNLRNRNILVKKDGSNFSSRDDAENYIKSVLHDPQHKRFTVKESYPMTTNDIARFVWSLRKKGKKRFDAVVFKNIYDIGTPLINGDSPISDVFAIPLPQQIKSANKNNGNFDPLDADQYHQINVPDDIASLDPDAQFKAVKKLYRNSPQWLKAPNWQDSQLSQKQWIQVRTPAFKDWFGDWENDPENSSKVLDDNGEPLVVYHRTKRGNNFYIFNIGSQGAHFGTREQADDRANGRLYPVFLNIRNPMRTSDQGANWNYEVKYAKKNDIDGLVYMNEFEGSERDDSWVVFYPEQIKSAAKNSGDFSSVNPDIYHQHDNNNPFVSRYAFDNPNTENQFSEAQFYTQRDNHPKGLKHSLLTALKGLNGDFPELAHAQAKNKGLTYAREILRMLKRSIDAQTTMAVHSLTRSLDKLDKKQFEIFTRLLLINDIYAFKRHNPNAALPLGFTPEALKNERVRFSKLAQNDPDVLNAIQSEHSLNSKIRNQLVALAQDLGLKKLADRINNNHFDSAMIDYAHIISHNSHDINANYIHAMGELRIQQLQDIQRLKAIKEIKAKYDIKDKLIKRFGEDWRIYIPNGFKTWNILSRNFIQSTQSLHDNILSSALDLTAKQLGLSDDTLQFIRANLDENDDAHILVLPYEIVNSIHSMLKPKDRGAISQFLKKITTGWKQFVLFFPTRAAKYNFRNITGDLDAVLAGNPKAVRFTKKAISELYTAFYGDDKDITPELLEFQKRGGALTAESAQELQDYRKMKEFKNLLSKIDDKNSDSWKSLPAKFWEMIDKFLWSGVQKASNFREGWLRYACYLEYLDQMQTNEDGLPDNFGASDPDEVMCIPDIRDRAFKLSNELLGAYDQVSETGQALRDLIWPFYSWIEVNAKRYIQLIKNGLTLDNPKDFIADIIKSTGIKSPIYAYRIGKTLLMVNLLALLIKAFNHLVWPDDEDKLPPDVQERPHITLGHDPITGDVLYFDRVGALTDNLEWFAGDSFASDIKAIFDGKMSVQDWVLKVCAAPLNKIVQGITPLIKTPFELATGKALYPDFTNPRNINDKLRYLAQSFGLSWPYKAVTGEPHSNWDEFKNLFVYSSDADEAAYFYTLGLVRQFRENVLGKRSGGFSSTRKSLALQNLKKALRVNDKEAVKRYLQEYYDLGGNNKGIKTSMRNMNPLHSLSKREQQQFLAWISEDDRKFLQRANKYFQTMINRLYR